MQTNKSSISSHALDTVTGRPASNLKIVLYISEGENFKQLFEGRTNKDGRITGKKIKKKASFERNEK